MSGDPIENNAYIFGMTLIDESLELRRRAVSVGRCVISRHLIPPGRRIRIFGNGKKLHVGESHLLNVRDQNIGKFFVIIRTSIRLQLPGAYMKLVNIYGFLKGKATPCPLKIALVCPRKINFFTDDSRGIGQLRKPESVRVVFVFKSPVTLLNVKFLFISCLGISGKSPPYAVSILVHRKI